MIRSISFKNFKSYRDATVPLAPLTLLIGANASGKSNAIEGIRFLSWLAEGRRLDDLVSVLGGADGKIRGRLENLSHLGGVAFGFRCEAAIPHGEILSIDIATTSDGAYIDAESIRSPRSSVPLYATVALLATADRAGRADVESSMPVQYDNFAHGGTKPRITCSNERAVFTQFDSPAPFGRRQLKTREIIPGVVGTYRRVLREILFFAPDPDCMRGYSPILQTRLEGDGSNLSGVLYDLCERRGGKQSVLDFIRTLPEQEIRDIDFLKTPRNEVMVRVTESFGGKAQTWDAPLLSGGTLRALAVAAAFLSAPEGSMVIMEEVENGVHPSRARMLIENIYETARTRHVRALITTHNPALMDALPDEAIGDVVCCYRDPEKGDSRLVRLADLDRYPELVAQGPLGQLMTRQVIDRFLKERLDREERRARSMAWLTDLKASHSG